MSITGADLSQWAAHRRAVVRTVSRRVPGVDPELAASRGLELLCVELIERGDVTDPVTFWSDAAVEVALEMAHEDPAPPDEDARAEIMAAPIRRALDLEVLSTAMERLSAGEQRILWDHHVDSRPVAAIADEIGVLPYAARRRLRRAENRLADSLADAHTGAADDAECKATRASMHDFVRHRLMPRRRQKVEDHMVQCADCTRAFVDVRESYWMLRAAAPVLLLGTATTAEAGVGVAAGAAAAGSAGVGTSLAALGTRAALTVRSALTDPVGLTATVAGGLFVTTAVTTGVAHHAGAVPTVPETGIVSVTAKEPVQYGVRRAVPESSNGPGSSTEDPTNLPEPTTFTSPGGNGGSPPGLATTNGEPPGLAATDGEPPGQVATDDGSTAGSGSGTAAPSDDTATDGTPPGLASKGGVPPGQAKKGDTPPGQEDKATPPGQAKKEDDTPPGQAKKDTPPGQEKKEDKTPPGQEKKKDTPPGQAKKNP